LSLLVLSLAALSVGIWLAWPQKPDIARDVFGNEEVLATFKAADSVTAQRLHYRRENPQNSRRLENYVQEAPVVVAPEQARELQQILLRESSYRWRYAKMCAPAYGVLLTFGTGKAKVRVALCFECNMLGIYDTADDGVNGVNIEKDFDPARQQLVAVAKAVFPSDSVIQSLK